MFELIKNNSKYNFYTVKQETIYKTEKDMGIIIPDTLKQFYLNVGYGFLETGSYNINRIMGPSSIEEFYLGTGQFENSEEVEIYSKYTKDKLVFFEVNESLFLSIGITIRNRDKIFYYDKEIANDISDFLKQYLENEKYFLDKEI